MHPDDKLTKDTPIAPPDAFESPREESIVNTDPHADLDDDGFFNEALNPGALDLNRVHGAAAHPATAPQTTGSVAPTASAHAAEGALPWKMIVGGVLLALWGGLYLGTYSGGFQGDVFSEYASYKAVASGPPLDPNSPEALKIQGKKVFTVNCVQCHQASGMGQAGQFPPLVASEWVVGNAPKRLTQILLHGIQGAINVKGAPYNNNMPAWSAVLKDREIAAVLTYIRAEWGNAAAPISEQDMAAARKETAGRTDPWTEAELLKIPEGPLSGAAAAGPAPVGNQPPAANANPTTVGLGDMKPAAAPLGQGPAANPTPKP